MRLIVPAIAALVFLAFAVLYQTRPEVYEAVLDAWAVPIGEIPFIDWHAVLSAIQCHRLGEDVLAANSCDLIGRPHVYSPFWLALPIPADTSHTMAWGIGLTGGLLLALATLPLPRTPRAVAVLLAAVLSPSVVMAIERANNDMATLLGAVVAGHLLARGAAARLGAYGLLVLAALLKYYPAVALVLAAREAPRRFLAVAAASLAAAVALGLAFADRWAESTRLLAWVLRFGLYTFSLRNPIEYAAIGHPELHAQPLNGLLLAGLLCAFAVLVAGWHVRLRREGLRLRLDRPADALLAVSGLIVAGCFVTGSSLPYRAVLLLPTLPALLHWAGAHPDAAARRTAQAITATLLLLLWLPLLHHAAMPLAQGGGGIAVAAKLWQSMAIALKEVGWWLATSFFVAVTVPVALEAPLWRSLQHVARPERASDLPPPRRPRPTGTCR